MAFVIDPIKTPSVAVAQRSERFPVRRIMCVGRNYAAHAREMGKDPDREPPFFFSKPADSVVDDGSTIVYPPQTNNFQYEAELIVAIGSTATCVPETRALDHIWGYGIGNDLTRRDLQLAARDKGRPWDLGKGFDHSAVIGPIHPVKNVGHLQEGRISLSVNGDIKQEGNLNELIWSVPEIISILSETITLVPGDLIMTGTPAGVGPLQPGDVCTVEIEGLGTLTTHIAPAA
ncbi:MAG: fumarylacetoacetate hydrolase family protein [Gammaproteobacteria bacterium]|nr:fumarylacetoacetate hydrolase family protein [Gammaproteobacteria bacterium]